MSSLFRQRGADMKSSSQPLTIWMNRFGLLVVLLLPQTLPALEHVVSPADLRKGIRAAAEVRQQNRAKRSEEHTSELQSPCNLVCRLLLEKKKKTKRTNFYLRHIKHAARAELLEHSLGHLISAVVL